MENKRLFAAIKIYPDAQFTDTYTHLKQALDHNIIKWVDIQNIHITLKFIGETVPDEVPVIQSALAKAIEGIEPFELQLANTGIFGSRYNPKVIWFGISHNQMLLDLVKNVASNLEEAGIYGDRQNFVPHLTIGRIREIRDKNHFQQLIECFRDITLQKQSVEGFELYESILQREGPIYNVIESYRF